ncbi:unnamed protein product [Absidia cylindrospora]
MVSTAHANKSAVATVMDHENNNNNKHPRYYQPHVIPLTVDQNGNVLAPTSPPYPPYVGNYVDVNSMPPFDPNYPHQQHVSPTGPSPLPHPPPPHHPAHQPHHYAYVYPVSPPFSVQYYTDYSPAGYQSYPGSPVLHPQSPPMNPSSPPFSPTYHYQGANITLSPPTHATYVIPPPGHQHQQRFPPLHISSPVLTGQQYHHPQQHHPGSPPRQYLPGPYDRPNSGEGNNGAPPPAPQHQSQHTTCQHHEHHHHQTKKPLPAHHHQQQQHHHIPSQQHDSSSVTPIATLELQQEEKEHMELQQAYQRQLQEQQQINHQYHSHNMYVRGLASSMTDETFLELCATYGSIISTKAILDQKSGECKGYGFAMYENEEDCLKAIDMLNTNGLQASLAKIGQESFSSRLRNLQDETSTNIYISNLPLDMTEQKLQELFLPCHTVSSRILRDPQSGLSRGVGFARLTDRYSAATIIDKYNGKSIAGSSAALQLRFADSPAQKKLKHQTARKRVFKTASPCDYQSMTAVTLGHPTQQQQSYQQQQLPVTPETILGFAPSQQQQQQPGPIHTALASPPEYENNLVESLDQKCKVENDAPLVSSA